MCYCYVNCRRPPFKVPLSQFGGVHGNRAAAGTAKVWRNKPLFRKDSVDRVFKTGIEATQLLNAEASRRDVGCDEFLQSWESMSGSLSVVRKLE
jgi:hypothetical protein